MVGSFEILCKNPTVYLNIPVARLSRKPLVFLHVGYAATREMMLRESFKISRFYCTKLEKISDPETHNQLLRIPWPHIIILRKFCELYSRPAGQ